MIIAVDGPAASGKGTIAKALALSDQTLSNTAHQATHSGIESLSDGGAKDEHACLLRTRSSFCSVVFAIVRLM